MTKEVDDNPMDNIDNAGKEAEAAKQSELKAVADAKASKEAEAVLAAAKEQADKLKEAPNDKSSSLEDNATTNPDEADQDDTWNEVASMGDEVADSVIDLLKSSEISVEDAKALVYDAIVDGDITKINRDLLVEKIGASKANLVMIGIESYVDKQTSNVNNTVEVVHKAAGGSDNWELVVSWVNDNMPEDQLNDLRDMVDQGGNKAKFAAQEFVQAYNKSTSNTSIDTSESITLTGDNKSDTSGRAINKVDYVVELEKAYKANDQTAVKEIQRARERGRKKGI